MFQNDSVRRNFRSCLAVLGLCRRKIRHTHMRHAPDGDAEGDGAEGTLEVVARHTGDYKDGLGSRLDCC